MHNIIVGVLTNTYPIAQ